MKRWVLVTAAAMMMTAGWCAAEDLPKNVQVAFIMKIIDQDANIAKNAVGGTVMVAVAYTDSSKKEADAMLAELVKAKGKVKVKGCDVNFCTVAMGAAGSGLSAGLREKNACAVYVTTDSEADIPAIAAATQNLKVLSLTGENASARVGKGITVGLEMNGGKPAILVNVKSSKAEGRDFPMQFLTLVKIM